MSRWNLQLREALVALVYGRYVAYACVWGGETLERGIQFREWVKAHPEFVTQYHRPDLYDLWLGVSV